MVQVIVDPSVGSEQAAVRGSGPPQIINIDASDLSDRIQRAIENISDPINNATERLVHYELERITFSIVVTATGEVSLLSVVKGSSSIQSGIQVTLVPRKKDNV